MESLTTILASGAFSAILVSILAWVTKTWFSERIRESIKHEYEIKALEYKTQLERQAEKQIIEFKAEIEKSMVLQAMGNKSLEEANRTKMTKTIAAVEVVWNGVIALRSFFPILATIIDSLPPDRVDLYTKLKKSPDFDVVRGDANNAAFTRAMTEKVNVVEPHRIFMGDLLWVLFNALQQIILRFYLTIHFEKDDHKVIQWYEDGLVKVFVEGLFTAEELSVYQTSRASKLFMIRENLEKKILACIKQLIAGETLASDSVRQANEIEKLVKALAANQPGKS